MYDINFIMPIAPSIEKYRKRVEDMKVYGLLNVGSARVLLTLLVEDSYSDTASLKRGWAPGIDVECIRVPYSNVEHKFAVFYLYHFPKRYKRARWISRIDDDSATDVSGLLRDLYEYDASYPMHLIAQETTTNLRDRHRELYRKFGFSDRMMDGFMHSWEISIDSAPACKRFVENPHVAQMYHKILDWSFEQQPWADASYCYGLRMCGVFPHHTRFLSKDPAVRRFSYFGGPFTHIHMVAHDNRDHAEQWNFFVREVNIRDGQEST